MKLSIEERVRDVWNADHENFYSGMGMWTIDDAKKDFNGSNGLLPPNPHYYKITRKVRDIIESDLMEAILSDVSYVRTFAELIYKQQSI